MILALYRCTRYQQECELFKEWDIDQFSTSLEQPVQKCTCKVIFIILNIFQSGTEYTCNIR